MKKVFVTIPDGDVKNTFLPDSVKKLLEAEFSVTYNLTGRGITAEETAELAGDADAIITGWGSPYFNSEIIQKMPNLSLIAHTGGTVGNLVDLSVYDTDVTVLSGNRLYAESVAEGVLCYMMTALRRIPDYISLIRGGQKWRTEADVWEGLFDRTIGIVGLGTISRILIGYLQPFRVKIKIFSHYPIEKEFLGKYNCTEASLDEIFSSCDVVSIHSALNDTTRGMITKEHFEALKDGSLFLNTARGDIIDQKALIAELKKDRFRAVLDVYHTEPIEADSELRTLKNVYCIPHMAGPTLDRRPYITSSLIENMKRYFAGEKSLELEITRDLAKRMTKM